MSIRELLSASLKYAGFDVSSAPTGYAGLQAVEHHHPDVVLLDVMLPDLDGFEVLRRLRAGGRDVPVLFLTARDAVDDRVTGLRLGGDDYVTKPFSLEEVIERVNAVLRRAGKGTPERSGVVRIADLELNEQEYVVRRAGKAITLSPTEFKLLQCLVHNAGRVLSKAQLLEAVWSYDFNGESGIVETYISYLRRKVDAVEPRLIHTVRGFGYVLRTPAAGE
ncbi:DNA-binding response regulator [Pseudonocardiaceae bacterium YIM PH 21723]|nr:DNA-binding response regulator [Pseudonocardiaceae bacterium YIM PH 21723]